MTVTSFSVSYDYRCPFAKNIHLHVIEALRANAPFDVSFVPWTLSQGSREEGELGVWDDPSRESELLALAVSISLRDQQPERFLDAHEALFVARHVRGHRLNTMEDLGSVLAEVNIDFEAIVADVASRRPFDIIRDSYRDYERWDAFGVPTFVVAGDAVFVRYMDPPNGDRAASVALITQIVTAISDNPSLNEFKHTQLSA